MAVAIAGLFSNSTFGLVGAVLLLLAHGFISAGLFFLVGTIYSRLGTRNIKYYGGISVTMPVFSILFVLFSFANISVPGMFSFIAEFLVLLGVMTFSMASSIFLSLVIILGAGYTVWLVNRILFGVTPILIVNSTDLCFRESILLITLVVRVIVLGFFRSGIIRY
jgi:NADH-quinone oxidoreductase subunit M